MSRVVDAAALMKARGQAADKGIGAERWFANPGGFVELNDFLDESADFNLVADTGNDPAFAEHIAALHPGVASVIADALTAIEAAAAWGDWHIAIAALNRVADAYLEQPGG